MEPEIYKNLSLEDIPNEVWRFIPNSDNLYMVSNMGRIKSLECVRKFGNTKRKHKERIMKQFPNWQGYLSCFIRKMNGEKIRISSHQCVADVFIPNPNKYPCVNHKNEIKCDNRADNLEHCTYSYNLKYGSRKYCNSTKVYQFSLNGDFISEFNSVLEAAAATKTNRSSISNCLCGLAKSANNFIWRNDKNKDDKIEEYRDYHKRPVSCFSLNGTFLYNFESIAEAGRRLNLCATTIGLNCMNKVSKVNKYIFKYKQ